MQTQITCPQCGAPVVADVYQVIDAARQPQLKQALMTGQLNVAQCQSCGWAGTVGTPMVYHDPAHELLMVFVPMEMNMGVQEREQVVGRLVRQVVDNTPPEQRRAYMLNPQQVLQWKTFVEKVLGTEGITPEMIQRQQRQMDLLQKLATVDKDVADVLLDDNKRLIDETFFAMLQQVVEALSRAPQGQAQAQLIKLANLRARLMTTTEVGRRLEERNLAMHALNMDAQRAGGLTPALLAQHVARHKDNDAIVDGLVAAGQQALSYEFFEALSAEIDAATDPADRRQLTNVRTRLVAMYDEMRAASDRILSEAQSTLDAILSAPDRQEAVFDNIEAIDDAFMMVLQAQLQEAHRAGDKVRAQALLDLQEELAQLAQDAMPPEVRLLNELLMAPSREEAQLLLEENADLVTPDFVEMMRGLAAELDAQGQTQLKRKLEQIQAIVAARV